VSFGSSARTPRGRREPLAVTLSGTDLHGRPAGRAPIGNEPSKRALMAAFPGRAPYRERTFMAAFRALLATAALL
jgi:hypothetical protein